MNSNTPRCNTCNYRNKYNACTNNNISEIFGEAREEKLGILIYPFQDNGWSFVGDNFSCVHHKENC